MSKASFLIKKIIGMDYGNLFRTVKLAHQRSGKASIPLFFDIIKCGFKYSAGHTDYLQAEMYALTPDQREDVITSGASNNFVATFNNPEYVHYFASKEEFNEKFKDYINRDWLRIDSENQLDDFLSFIEGKDYFMLKPINGSGGEGVQKLPATKESFDEVLKNTPCLVEEVVKQCDEMASLNSTSVNTIRPLTFVTDDGEAILLAAYLRIGRGGVVDNFCSGGMLSPINPETGEIEYPAVDEHNDNYPVHPLTGKSIVGFKVPRFQEVKDLVLKAALVVPEIRYVGWDIAITDNGPVIIEGNDYPSHAFFNFKTHHPDGKGLKKEFEKKMGIR